MTGLVESLCALGAGCFVAAGMYAIGLADGRWSEKQRRHAEWNTEQLDTYETPGGRHFILTMARQSPASVPVMGVLALADWITELIKRGGDSE